MHDIYQLELANFMSRKITINHWARATNKSQIIPELVLEPLRDYVTLKNKLKLVQNLPTIAQAKEVLLRTSGLMKEKIAHVENYSSMYFHEIQEVLIVGRCFCQRRIRLVNRLVNSSYGVRVRSIFNSQNTRRFLSTKSAELIQGR